MTTTTAPSTTDLTQMAHLLRRAAFGVSRDELNIYARRRYEDVVEDLLDPTEADAAADAQDLVDRFFTASVAPVHATYARPQWSWRLLTTSTPLVEKMALFWHQLFATAARHPMHSLAQLEQIEMFRRRGLGRFEDLLLALSRDPAMLFWLDNQTNHRDAPNENYGRELLELFTLGIGNYTEADVKAAARAFTGWTVRPPVSAYMHGAFPMAFAFDPADHDDGLKTFLGHTGHLDGHDIVAILARHPGTARFVCGRLYRFFVADEPGDRGQAEIQRLAALFIDADGDIRTVLRALLLSEHFRSPAVRYRKVKSPVELAYGLARITDDWARPSRAVAELATDTHYMGQSLLEPPSVEGWHEGPEWIDTACLVERINFASARLARPDSPGVARMLDRIVAAGPFKDPNDLVGAALDALGAIEVSPRTRQALLDQVTRAVSQAPPLDTDRQRAAALDLLQAVVATPDFQYC